MFGVTKYVLMAALVAVLVLAGLLVKEMAASGRLAMENGRLRGAVATCSARIQNIQEDMQSDATVTDPASFDVPAEWMRETGIAD